MPFKSELFGCEETPDDFVPPWEPPKKEVDGAASCAASSAILPVG